MFEIEGLKVLPGFMGAAAQQELVSTLRKCVAEAPLYQPVMPRTGRPLSVRMTNLGQLGWISDRQGYRYQPHHPATGKPWPEIPAALLEIWQEGFNFVFGFEPYHSVSTLGGWSGVFLACYVQATRWHCPGFPGHHNELAVCYFTLER